MVTKTKRPKGKKKKKQKARISFLKEKLFFSGLALFGGLALFCFWGKAVVFGKKEEPMVQIFISEIMFNPLGKSEKGKEWIEIYFPHETELESKEKKDGKFVFPLEVCYRAKEEESKIECEKSAEIFSEKRTIEAKKGEYWLIVQDKKEFCQEYFGLGDGVEECLEEKKGGILESDFTLYNSSQNFVGILLSFEESDENEETMKRKRKRKEKKKMMMEKTRKMKKKMKKKKKKTKRKRMFFWIIYSTKILGRKRALVWKKRKFWKTAAKSFGLSLFFKEERHLKDLKKSAILTKYFSTKLCPIQAA